MNIDPQLQKIIDFYNSPEGQELIKQEKKVVEKNKRNKIN